MKLPDPAALRARYAALAERTGRDFAGLTVNATGWVFRAATALLWAFLAAVGTSALFGEGIGAAAFCVVLVGYFWEGLGQLVLMIFASMFPGAILGGIAAVTIGGSFTGWMILCTVGVVIYCWAKTVTAPPPDPAPPMGTTLQQQRPAWLEEIQAHKDIEVGD